MPSQTQHTADSDGSVNFATVLAEEKDHLNKSPSNAAALCISGGGIRSATFALGVLQGLAGNGTLQRFDYLSTVSGGGYIGSWLSAWIRRAGRDTVMSELAPSTHPEPVEVSHLRRYSNYLIPKLGLLSTDSWSVLSIFVRNLMLNWLVLVPALFAVLLLPRLFVSLIAKSGFHAGQLFPVTAAAIGIAVILIVAALVNERKSARGQQFLFVLAILLLLAAAILAALELWQPERVCAWEAHFQVLHRVFPWVGAVAVIIFVVYVLIWRFVEWLARILRFVNAFLLGSALLGLEVWFLVRDVIPFVARDARLFVCVAAPLCVVALTLSGYLITGLTHFDLSDQHREWLSSLGGWLLMYALVWSVSSALSLFGPVLFYAESWKQIGLGSWASSIATYGSAVGTIVAALATALGGYGASATAGRREAGVVPRAVKIGLPAFVILLALLLTRLADPVLIFAGAVAVNPNHITPRCIITDTEFEPLLKIIAGLVLSSLVLSRFISVNKFSLHGMYRNRLIRAYLGASNRDRKPNPVTGFDPADNILMSDLRGQIPLHVVNMTLNLVGGKELAWQERKAESFAATAYRSGTERPGGPGKLGYRNSADYGGKTDGPISLGTAKAISGAAANPNMGYSSSPLLTFLMTLFNARLGWWLGNPGYGGEKPKWLNPSWNRSGPAFGILYLFAEAFGLTTDETRYINLSDGGHFENLALYEMIRRECGFIVVIDGGHDPQLTLEDLGNAIRKCRIDFGANIAFDNASLNDLVGRRQRWAVANIRYASGHAGRVVYLKPLMSTPDVRDEPPDVRTYHDQHPDFPHEPTSDQFFSESQFESYRRLGLHTILSVPPDILSELG